MDLRTVDRRDLQFSKTLEAGLSHLKSLMEICHWQSEQGRWFLHEDPHHSWSQNTKALRTLESLSGVRVTKTKHFGTFMTKCPPIVDELESSSTNPGTSPILFATSVLRVLRRTLEEVAGAIDSTEAGPTVEEECPVQKRAREPGQVSCDEVTVLPLDTKLVADAIKEELMFMRGLRVYHEVLVSYPDTSGLKAIGTRWVYTNKGDAANPFIRALFFNSIRGTPRSLLPDDEPREPREPREQPLRIDVRPVHTDLPPPINTELAKPRRVYVRISVEVARYGYTPGCVDL